MLPIGVIVEGDLPGKGSRERQRGARGSCAELQSYNKERNKRKPLQSLQASTTVKCVKMSLRTI